MYLSNLIKKFHWLISFHKSENLIFSKLPQEEFSAYKWKYVLIAEKLNNLKDKRQKAKN